jgi:hypothetical protein
MTMLLKSVLVPVEPNSEDVELRFAAQVSNLVRNLGFIVNTVTVAHAKRIVIRRYEKRYGHSNLTVWRLCQMTMQDLIHMMGSEIPRYDPNVTSPFAVMSNTRH